MSKTECKDCGRKGHWRGDKECTMRKSSYVASFDSGDEGPDDSDDSVDCLLACVDLDDDDTDDNDDDKDEDDDDEFQLLDFDDTIGEELEFVAFMATKLPEPVAKTKERKAYDLNTGESSAMEWTFASDYSTPTCSDQVFKTGSFKNKTWSSL